MFEVVAYILIYLDAEGGFPVHENPVKSPMPEYMSPIGGPFEPGMRPPLQHVHVGTPTRMTLTGVTSLVFIS